MTKKEVICADCGGWDIEWMYRCDKHKTEFCRGCSCPDCQLDALEDDADREMGDER